MIATDLAAMIVNAGLGVFAAASGWSVNVGKEPTAPDTCITVYPTGGPAPHPSPDFDSRMLRAQIRVRGAANGYVPAEAKLEAIRAVFHGKGPDFLNAHFYGGFWIETEPALIGFDDTNRPLFTMNISALSGGMSAAA